METAAAGSVSKAAEKLCVTPSAVSRRVKFLEDQYGYPLLDRSGPILKPTEAGRLVIEKAIRILLIEKELMSGLRCIRDRQCISFCCTPAFGIAYLPGILKSFIRADANPDDLNLLFGTPDSIVQRLKEHTADLAVLEHCSCFDLKECKEYPLPEEEMVFVSAPKLEVESGGVDVDALAPYRLFTRSDRCCSRIFLDENLQRLGKDIGVFGSVILCEDLNVIIRAVANGAGIAYLSRSLVEGPLQGENLRIHYVDGFTHRFGRTLVVRESSRPNARRTAFIKAVFSAYNLETPPP
jgi:DNA-binding transcriptional LysR family regulator